MKQEDFHDGFKQGNWQRFILRDTNWCMDREHCHSDTSNLRLSECDHCGAMHWLFFDKGDGTFYLAEDDGLNCIYNNNGTPAVHHCKDGNN
jgi:hypothetical protein